MENAIRIEAQRIFASLRRSVKDSPDESQYWITLAIATDMARRNVANR